MPTTIDPTDAMCDHARRFDDVVESTSCSQASFKRGKTAFFYAGPQGGRYKAMFKLDRSLDDARQRADDDPDRFQVGKNAWVTARFSADAPMPKRLWTKWLRESYELAG